MHDRAYALLGDRVRLGTRPRRALYSILLVLQASGLWWVAVHFAGVLGIARGDDLGRVASEAWAMKLHGAAAIVTLLILGAMLATHAKVGWRLRRNRVSGTTIATAAAVLVCTGYALYYLVDDTTRPPVSTLHWVLGAAMLPGLVIHIALGRRSRREARTAYARSVIEQKR